MNIAQIVDVLEKRVAYLQTLKSGAYAEGDLTRYDAYQLEIEETEATLTTLRPHI
jgi:hypothetical protein